MITRFDVHICTASQTDRNSWRLREGWDSVDTVIYDLLAFNILHHQIRIPSSLCLLLKIVQYRCSSEARICRSRLKTFDQKSGAIFLIIWSQPAFWYWSSSRMALYNLGIPPWPIKPVMRYGPICRPSSILSSASDNDPAAFEIMVLRSVPLGFVIFQQRLKFT